MCDEAFNESAAALRQLGMPANWIACISHMLCDERVVACLIPISVPVPAAARPTMLDKQKADSDSIAAKEYAEIFANYKTWQKTTLTPFVTDPSLKILICSNLTWQLLKMVRLSEYTLEIL